MLYGMDIGGSKIEINAFDSNLNSKWRKRIKTPRGSYEHFLDVCAALVMEADSNLGIKGRLGVGIPGMIDRKNKTIYTTNINIAKNRPFISDLSKKLERGITVENDANCFTLSEASSPGLKDYNNILGVVLGTGLGGGVVINKKIVAGLNGCAGEIGHIQLPIIAFSLFGYSLPVLRCSCGRRGCCERYLSGTGFAWLYNHCYQQALTTSAIIENYYNNDNKAIEYVDRYSELLALYLSNLLIILDSEAIVIGGGLSNFDALYEQLSKRLPRYLLSMMDMPHIVKARFGDSSGARGAALLLLQSNSK